MNAKRTVFAGIALTFLLQGVSVFAQEDAETPPPPQLTAAIIGPEDTPVGRTIIMDASPSRIVGANVRYAWYVNGDASPISTTVDAIYTPEDIGDLEFRLVVRSIVNGEQVEDEESHMVTVYRRKVTLIVDAHVSPQVIDALREAAAEGSTYLRVLRAPVSAMDPGGEEALVTLLVEEGDALLDAESVVLWTDGLPTPGLFALLQSVRVAPERAQALPRTTLLLPTTLNLRTVARTVKGATAVLEPERAFIVRPSLVELLLTSEDDAQFLQRAREVPSEEPLLLDASVVRIPWYYPLTRLVNGMMGLGVSSQTLLLLLVLPVIATILSFLKQIVGMTTFGLFTPSIIALSFLVLGWVVGVLFLLFILSTGYLSRALMRRLHILYIPKMAIILGIGSFTLLLLVGIGTFYGVTLSHDTVFVLLIMSTLVESFLNVKSEQGLQSAVLAIGQTVVAALLCIFVVQWPPFRALIMAYPEILLLTVVINILLGRFTGLRVTEYFRFREVFKHLAQEE